jgi:hypothetical protein
MTSPDDLEDLRASILASAPDPADDPNELGRNTAKALRLARGEYVPEVQEVRVRLHGSGVTGHTVPVHDAAKLLDALQGTVTAIGRATRKTAERRVNGNEQRVPVGDVTRLNLSADVAPGSVVFFLTGPEERVSPTNDETLLDRSLRELFHLLDAAGVDDPASLGKLTSDLQRLGVRVASQLNGLVATSIDSEIDVDLGWRTAAGKRSKSALARRGALALKDAIERNRVTTTTVTMQGTLKTVSDGTDKLRLELQDGKTRRLSVDAETGSGLGSLHMKTVSVTADETVTWTIATGQERKRWKFVSAEVVDQLAMIGDDGTVDTNSADV